MPIQEALTQAITRGNGHGNQPETRTQQREHAALHYVGHGFTGNKGMAVGVALRPEKIILSKEKPKGEHNWAEGVVTEIVYFGDHTTYHLKTAAGHVIKAQEINNTRDLSCGLTWGDHAYMPIARPTIAAS